MPRCFLASVIWKEPGKGDSDGYGLESCESFLPTHWDLVLETGLSREALRASPSGLGFLTAWWLSVWGRCSHRDTVRELAFSENLCKLCVVLAGLRSHMLSLLLYVVGWHSYKSAHIQRTGAKALLSPSWHLPNRTILRYLHLHIPPPCLSNMKNLPVIWHMVNTHQLRKQGSQCSHGCLITLSQRCVVSARYRWPNTRHD